MVPVRLAEVATIERLLAGLLFDVDDRLIQIIANSRERQRLFARRLYWLP